LLFFEPEYEYNEDPACGHNSHVLMDDGTVDYIHCLRWDDIVKLVHHLGQTQPNHPKSMLKRHDQIYIQNRKKGGIITRRRNLPN